jgi:hypothetical protein
VGDLISFSPAVTSNKWTASSTRLEFADALDFDEWRAIGAELARIEKGVQWWLGDWWAFGEHRYGERAKAAADGIFGRSFGGLANCGSVARAFETSRRREVLPFSHHVEAASLDDPAEADALLDQAVREDWTVRQLRAAIRQQRDDARKAALHAPVTIDLPNLHVGDFRELAPAIPDASVELVFTDPPYDRGAIPLYEAAAQEAARILKPGGSLISYCGHVLLPDVLPAMCKHLRYFWIGAHVHDGDPHARMREYGVIVGFKPLLWFVKEHRGDKQSFVADTVLVAREKQFHPWQQAVATAEHFIRHLTSDAGVVVDFFAGGGTTCVAAQRLGRPWIAFEIDPKHAGTTAERLRADIAA